ncbi:MAG: DUF6600 domain-containing protein [Bacteroidia bacterium]
MKFSTRFFAIVVITIIASVIKSNKLTAQETNVSFEVFYDNLSPYGQWVDYPNYGYVWVPQAGPDFVPYSSGGYWAWTDYGWTWVSNYDWGWAPFHYGRWDYDDYYGWFWMPGNEWGPAWVSWRRSPGYYGWAPLGPNVSLDVAFGNNYIIPNDHWVFVDEHYLGRQDINNYYGPRKNNAAYVNNSTVINNTYIDNSRHTTYVTGPKKEEVQKVTGKPIKQYAIKENSKPGQAVKNNELRIYRPAVVKKDNVKPSKITDRKDVQPIAQRKVNTQPQVKNNTQPANQNKQHTNPAYSNPAQKNNNPQKQNQPQNNNKQTTPADRKVPNNAPQQKVNQNPAPRNNPQPRQQNIPKNNPQPTPRNTAPAPREHTQQSPHPLPQAQAPPPKQPHIEAPQQPIPQPIPPQQVPQQPRGEEHRPH